MSQESRSALFKLWQDSNIDKYLRESSLSLWAETVHPEDLIVLKAVSPSNDLFELIVAQRLIRGDKSAIPEMIKGLEGDHIYYWWQFGRYVWSPNLSNALDKQIAKRDCRSKLSIEKDSDIDGITSELLMRLPTDEAESLLLKHWSYLFLSPCFVQAALYIATPRLQALVKNSVEESPDPTRLFEHLTIHWGCGMVGHPGLTKQDQLLALKPYFTFLSPHEIRMLYDICNKKSWFNLRHEIFDKHISTTDMIDYWTPDKGLALFEKALIDQHSSWLHYRIDVFLKAGVLWNDIFTSMIAWLEQNSSLNALTLVTSVLAKKGVRYDLTRLKYSENLGDAAMEIITDTTFAIYRRSLH